MSEWVNYARDAASCSYLDGELRGVARKSGEAWLWFVEDYSSTHRGEPVETRDLARESCDIVAVARLHYRPRTRNTSEWWATMQKQGPAWVAKYDALGAAPAIPAKAAG